jgi:molecular chaperone GrpE
MNEQEHAECCQEHKQANEMPCEKKEVSQEDKEMTLQQELSEFKDKYFRALAEIENTRKRLQREKIESQSYALQNVICDFLQPLDHFEQALKHTKNASQEIRAWAIGFEMMLTQFKQVLADHGATSFESKGAQFDPHEHEAIETEERIDVAPGTILEEYVKGYKLASRVIRPAKVKVATTPVTANEQEAQNAKQDPQ